MANAATVGILRVLLSANTAEFDAAMKRASATADGMAKNWKSIGQQATQVGSALTKAFTVPLFGIGVGAAKLATDFESSFAGVRKTVKASEAEFAAMAQGFRELSKTIPVNVNELNRLGEAAGALGIPKAEIVDFARVMALLGVTTNVTSEEAASSIAKIQNIFGAAGKDTERFASTLVALGNEGASTEQEILALANRIASAGNAVGLSQGQVLGFASAIANVGIEAEAGGSAISRVFADIALAVSHGGEAVSGFATVAGTSVEEFSRLFKTDASAAVLSFVEGLGRVKTEGGDLIGTLEELGFKEIRQANLLLSLALSGDNLRHSLDLQGQAWKNNSALSNEARERFKTTESQLTLLWNRIKDVGITLGNALLPAIKMAIGGAEKLIPVIDAAAKIFAAMPTGVQGVVIALGLLLAAVGPVIFIFGQMAISASALIGVFGKKGLATRALAIDQGTLAVSSTKLSAALGILSRAMAVASAGLIGWEIGRLIAKFLDLDNQIDRTINRMDLLEEARRRAAGGSSGSSQVSAQLIQMERDLAAAIRDGNKAKASRLEGDIAALKNDHAMLAIQDTVNAAIRRGAAATITYTEAVKFNAEWDKKRTDGLTAQAAAQQAAGRATETAVQKLDRMAQAQAAISAANKLYAQELTGIKDALRLQIQHMDETGKSTKDLADEYKISEQTVSRFKSELDKSEKSLVKTGKAATAVATALKELQNRIDGVPLVEKAKEWEAALKAPGMAAKVLADEGLRRELKDALDQTERKFGSLKAAGVGSMTAIHQAMKNMVVFAETIPPAIIPTIGATTRANLDQPQMINPIIPTISVDTESSILVAEQAASTFGTHFGQKLKANLSETIRNLPQLILESMKTGAGFGEVAGTIGIALGQDIGEAIGGPLGESFSNAVTALITNTNVQQAVENLGIELGAALGESIGGAIGGPLGAAVGKLLGGIAGSFLDNIFKLGQRETNNRRDEFLAQFGPGGTGAGSGFRELADQLHALGAAGDAMFQRLIRADDMAAFAKAMKDVQDALAGTTTAASDLADSGFQTQAQLQAVADKALRVYEQIKASGLYTAAVLEEAWERYQKAQEAALGVSPKALAAIKALDDELASLHKSIENEAPEAEIGNIEKETLAQIEAVQAKRDAAQQAMDAAAEASRTAAQTAGDALAQAMTGAASRIEDAFAGIYRDRGPITIPVNFEYPGGSANQHIPEGADPRYRFAHGGLVPSYFDAGGLASALRPKGTDTVPAMLTPGEGVLSVPAMRIVGREQLEALNTGRISSQSWRGESQPAQVATGSRVLKVYVTVQGDVKEDQTPKKIALAVAKEINHGGEARTVWEREIASMARVRVDA